MKGTVIQHFLKRQDRARLNWRPFNPKMEMFPIALFIFFSSGTQDWNVPAEKGAAYLALTSCGEMSVSAPLYLLTKPPCMSQCDPYLSFPPKNSNSLLCSAIELCTNRKKRSLNNCLFNRRLHGVTVSWATPRDREMLAPTLVQKWKKSIELWTIHSSSWRRSLSYFFRTCFHSNFHAVWQIRIDENKLSVKPERCLFSMPF